jgi:tRNA(Ile)-lysidine synthase
MLTDIEKTLFETIRIPESATIIVALSGGPDSIFLLYALDRLKTTYNLSLIAAHLDHQWRNESHDELLFCKKTAEQLSIMFVSEQACNLPNHLRVKGSKEATGRNMRRHFLQTVAERYHADAIALGHHAQDQQETFFIRLIRGTSLSGLCGMKEQDGIFIRPLLSCNKSDILTYLEQKNIAYVTDQSNQSPDYLRNRIRKEVISALHACDQRFEHNFARTQKKITEAELFLTAETTKLFANVSNISESLFIIDLKKLFSQHVFMQKRIVVQWLIMQKVPCVMTEQFIDEIIRFLQKPAGKIHRLHEQWGIEKKRHKAFIIGTSIQKTI